MNNNVVSVVIEHRFYKCSQGFYWSENSYEYSFWKRYLSVYEKVIIIARVLPPSMHNEDVGLLKRVDGAGVSFFDVPYYLGPKEFVCSFHRIVACFFNYRKKLVGDVILRYPSILSHLFYSLCVQKGVNRVGVEVVGDPQDTFNEVTRKVSLLNLYKIIFVKAQKKACRFADSISYVTKYKLQERYPPSDYSFQTHYSSIDLKEEDFHVRDNYKLGSKIEMICIGNLSFDYKCCDLALKVVDSLNKIGLPVHLTWIGGGKLQSQYELLADKMNLNKQVSFIGNVADKKVIHSYLDSADIFLLTSKQEGLPRVLIESMARSLYCISTNVGGVGELLKDEFISNIDDKYAFVKKIKYFYSMSESNKLLVSSCNMAKAKEYCIDELSIRRTSMYLALKG
jgi:colanic acid/amylovoran biosynthesis glycosyltransferase